MMGLEGAKGGKWGKGNGQASSTLTELDKADAGRGAKRKFELDEDKLSKNANDERAKARKALDDEKVRPCLASPISANVKSMV